jgi:hypothetical protein
MQIPRKSNPTDDIIDDISRSIYRWNNLYPLDRWYRNKFNIRFNSPEHKDIDIADIRLAYEEEMLYKQVDREHYAAPSPIYVPRTGTWLEKQPDQSEVTLEESNDIYEGLDLNEIEGDPDIITVNVKS